MLGGVSPASPHPARFARRPPLGGGKPGIPLSPVSAHMLPKAIAEERPMTPQERELIADLFDRLARIESEPRDPEADRAIAEGLVRPPPANDPLVQPALVPD